MASSPQYQYAHNLNIVARAYDTGTQQTRTADAPSRGRSSQPGVNSTTPSLAHYYLGSGMASVGAPSVYSPSNQGIVTSPPSQMVPQPPNQTFVAPLRASNIHHSTSPQYNNIGSFPSGPYASNPSAAHVPPPLTTSATKQPRTEVRYNAAGVTGVPPPHYVTPGLQPSPTTKPITKATSTGDYAPSPFHGSGSTPSSSNTHQTRSGPPLCKLPRCDKPAIFDRHINEQREYCGEHIKHAISVGFAGCCLWCKKMPARLESRFCSEVCNAHAKSSPGTSLDHQQTTVQPAVPKIRPPKKNPTVPDGLGQACQECRRPMEETPSRYCSKECKEASRKFRGASRP